MKLNARQIDTAKPKEKAYKLADGGGLYLLVKPSGGKYWRFKYRVAGKEKLLALGVYPEVTLADARAKREEAKGDRWGYRSDGSETRGKDCPGNAVKQHLQRYCP